MLRYSLVLLLLIGCGKRETNNISCYETNYGYNSQISCSNGYTYTFNKINQTCKGEVNEL